MSTPLDTLPKAVYSAAQVRELDRVAIEERGVAGYELMCRAGQAALEALQRRWPAARKLAVYCGAGNNAGDGYVLGRLAMRRGFTVRVFAVLPSQRLEGDAARAWQDFCAAGGSAEPFDEGAGFDADVIADALLGTGLSRALEGALAQAVAQINAAGVPVLALDVPSGLHAETGRVLGQAVRAALTITFVGLKQGLFLGAAPDYRGELAFSDLGVPADVYAGVAAPLERLTPAELTAALPPRARSAHKGDNGRLLLVGGGPGMAGAIRLAAEAALRSGAGLVYVATHPDNAARVLAGRPEIMCHGIGDPGELKRLAERADGVVLGPGLGQSAWARALWEAVLNLASLPVVLDADGLNLLSRAARRRDHWILTPHPGEAARLLGRAAAEIEADRLGAVTELAARFQAVAVLKGAFSLVAAPDAPGGGGAVWVCDRGNPGMATAGMGDVLAGILGALLVQTRDVRRSARAGVLLHALAGDDAAGTTPRGTLAGDLMPHIRRWANPG